MGAGSWREFFEKFYDTAGITLVFAALGSSFLLWAGANRVPPRPVTPNRALVVVAAGQIVGAAATAACFGWLGWSLFIAPAVGAVCGIVGFFLLLTTMKVGERVEDRGDDIADRGIDILSRRSKGSEP